MEHTINVNGVDVTFRFSGLQVAIANGKDGQPRRANGCELLAEAPWAAVRALADKDAPRDVPCLGRVLEVGVPLVDPVPAGTLINLVTAAGA